MAFKGMESRLAAKAHAIYHEHTLKSNGNEQPFLEFAPDDTNRNETAKDSRLTPVGSVRRDAVRISSFLNTSAGKAFISTQQMLQRANTFSETRKLNSSFIIDHVTPSSVTTRATHGTSDFVPTGDTSQVSPASDSLVGGAGRLQVASGKHAIERAVGQSGPHSVISLIPVSKLAQLLNGAVNILDAGSESINGRPELTINGNQYYSIMLWQRYQKNVDFKSSFAAVKQNLRIGNIRGAQNVLTHGLGSAIVSAANGVSDIINSVTTLGGLLGHGAVADLAGRNTDQSGIEGRRYFITGEDTADRYIQGSIDYYISNDNFNVPFDTNNIRHKNDLTNPTPRQRLPYASEVAGVTKAVQAALTKLETAVGLDRIKANVESIKSKAESDLRGVSNKIRSAISDEAAKLGPFKDVANALRANTQDIVGLGSSIVSEDQNPAESKMKFPGLSLRQRYLRPGVLDNLQKQLASQQVSGSLYWSGKGTGNLPFPSADEGNGTINQEQLGFTGGRSIGPVARDPNGVPTKVSGGYLQDHMNHINIMRKIQGSEVTKDRLNKLHNTAYDLIDVIFFDVVNKNAVPFRAYMTNLVTKVSPQFQDKQYVGRIERNIVYTGVRRDVTFNLKVHAFSPDELPNIHKKVDYLKGMCYPGGYADGFMVPPFVKFTVGDMYRNQPAYISSLTEVVEDGTSWETDDGSQVPHGITLNIALSIIEKTQKTTTSPFIAYTE